MGIFRPGQELVPGYFLEAYLGRGQYGEVWQTKAPGGAKIACKIIDLGGRAGAKEFRAVRRVKDLRHANLMPIVAIWVLDDHGELVDDSLFDSLCAASDCVAARDRTNLGAGLLRRPPRHLIVGLLLGDRNLLDLLHDYTEQGQTGIPPNRLLSFMEQAAVGIDFLNKPQHDLGQGTIGIQHCDMKPENIMLLGDSVLICDFGLSTVLAASGGAATATGMVGSLAYMSPECCEHKPSSRSDQYSLAITYYELRTGELPFVDKSYLGVLDAVRHGRLDFSRVSSAERKVLHTATRLRPESRYPTASKMVEELRRALQATPISLGTRIRRLFNRSRHELAIDDPHVPDEAALRDSHCDLGLLLWNRGRFDDAVREFRQAARLGSAIATSNLGVALILGKGVAQDYILGFQQIERAATAGYVKAIKNLAQCYSRGLGVARNMDMAESLLRQAIQQATMQQE